ncbi:MAG: nucleoside/nucleotide kinase family protein [Pseudomonadota bacterium]
MPPDTLQGLAAVLLARAPSPHRRLIALTGPPASGKSTFAEALAKALTDAGEPAAVVPMDGFHLDDRLLIADGTRDRKGAPHTFDALGFIRLIEALQSTTPVIYPIFNRAREEAIAGAGRVPAEIRTVVVEGNYLLLNMPPWDRLQKLWTATVALLPPREVLHARLVARWQEHDKPDAAAWIETNDMPNAQIVLSGSAKADYTYTETPT